MKYLCILFIMVTIFVSQAWALDHIILRDGRESDVKLKQITNDKIIFSGHVDSSIQLEEIPTSDIYMVYVEKQGNIYFKPDGTRITGEVKRVDRDKYDIIYLLSGSEIGAKNIRVTEDEVNFNNVVKGGFLNNILGNSGKDGIQTIPKSDIFMIRYKSGMIDIINSMVVQQQEEVIPEEIKQPQYIVKFHNVLKGETLKGIAERYNVMISQIREWNDLSVKIKDNAVLTSGMQLMIYQPKEN